MVEYSIQESIVTKNIILLSNMSFYSKVTEKVVIIDDVGRNPHVSTIVKSLQCKELELKNTILNEENTKYLVEAMERVRRVLLDDVSLKIEELCRYSGKGQCSEISVGGSTKKAHSSRLKIWRQRVNWIVSKEDYSILHFIHCVFGEQFCRYSTLTLPIF